MKIYSYISGLIFILLVGDLWAQNDNFRSRSSFGITAGGSYYIGDLNRFGHFRNTNLSAGLIYKYHLNSRLEIRGGFRYGKVEGYDSDSDDAVQQARNLSFQSDIFELGAGIEFNYLNYKLGNPEYFYTPYMFVEIAAFHMNPKTKYNDDWVKLRELGTEGQGSHLSKKKPYSTIQMSIPMGIGFKINLGKRFAASVEYGIRMTFTDYLDDVGKGDFLDRNELAIQNGPLTAELADRSLPGFKMHGKRGNPRTMDWYSMFGITFSFSLGNTDHCYYK